MYGSQNKLICFYCFSISILLLARWISASSTLFWWLPPSCNHFSKAVYLSKTNHYVPEKCMQKQRYIHTRDAGDNEELFPQNCHEQWVIIFIHGVSWFGFCLCLSVNLNELKPTITAQLAAKEVGWNGSARLPSGVCALWGDKWSELTEVQKRPVSFACVLIIMQYVVACQKLVQS